MELNMCFWHLRFGFRSTVIRSFSQSLLRDLGVDSITVIWGGGSGGGGTGFICRR